MDKIEIAKQALRDLNHEELNSLVPFIKNILKSRRQQASLSVLLTLKPGDRVRILNIKPKYMIGVEGEVINLRVSKVLAKFPGTDWANGVVIPASCLLKIG